MYRNACAPCLQVGLSWGEAVLQSVWYPGQVWLSRGLIHCPPLHWERVTPLGWEIASSLPGKSNDPIGGLLKSDRFPGTMQEQINLGNCWYLWFNRSYLFLCFSHWVYGAHYHFIWGFQVLGLFSCTVALWKSLCKIDPQDLFPF